jgi:hypothetical protein
MDFQLPLHYVSNTAKPHEGQLDQERCWYYKQPAKAKCKAKPRNVQFCWISWVPKALFSVPFYLSETCEIQHQFPKGGYIFVTLSLIVALYRDSVDGTRDRVTFQKLVEQ